jgi:hypothetical protein
MATLSPRLVDVWICICLKNTYYTDSHFGLRAFLMANPRLKAKAPRTINRTVPPVRPKNADLRTREYLTEAEVEKLMGGPPGATATATGTPPRSSSLSGMACERRS